MTYISKDTISKKTGYFYIIIRFLMPVPRVKMSLNKNCY